jgi:hypothetical protein
MIKQLFQQDPGQKILYVDLNSDLHIINPDGDKSVYFYLKNHADLSYTFLIEWNDNKWNVNVHNKWNANMFFNIMKRYPQIYKNFVKKIISNRNMSKING